MKVCRIIVPVLALFSIVACTQKIKVNGTLTDVPKGTEIVIKQLDGASYTVLDTVRTKGSGSFSYKFSIRKGEPEFVYFFYSGRKVASLLLEEKGNVTLEADTLGHYSVKGSESSEKLRDVEYALSEFNFEYSRLISDPKTTQGAVNRLFVDYYRDRVKYVMTNASSMTAIPVLYQKVAGDIPLFSQSTDALHFRSVCDSLMGRYPDSRYVQALKNETERREKLFSLEVKLNSAEQLGFPDITLPDIKGRKCALSSLKDRCILLYFWDPSDRAQKMYSLDVLLPVYNQYRDRGFNIYSVALSPDKVGWAASVRAQELPWVNVCDIRGASSPLVRTYNINGVPGGILIFEGNLSGSSIKGEQDLRRELNALL